MGEVLLFCSPISGCKKVDILASFKGRHHGLEMLGEMIDNMECGSAISSFKRMENVIKYDYEVS